MLKINGVAIPTPSSFQASVLDISNAERNANGDMNIDRVATKRKIEVEWKQISNTSMSALLKAVEDIFFTVTYPDPYTGTEQTKTFYVGDRTAPMYNYNAGSPVWENLKMNFIER